MADQDEDDQEIVPGNDPIAEAVNAGARFKVPESAAISRKRKLNVNSENTDSEDWEVSKLQQ